MNGSHRVGLAEYVHNMEGMIDQAGEHFTKKIVCVGFAPIDESRTVPFILEKTLSFYSLDRHEHDLALEKICNRKNVTYVPLRSQVSRSSFRGRSPPVIFGSRDDG
jgi:hypothetical protein